MKTISFFSAFIILMVYSGLAFAQNSNSRTTYTFEGFIETSGEEPQNIKLNFLVLLDSTIIGSYQYQPLTASFTLIGHMNQDHTFRMTARNENDSITGQFQGSISIDRNKAKGMWIPGASKAQFKFEIQRVTGKSYWDYISHNRNLQEYKDLKLALRKKAKVRSIDVASQGLSELPGQMITLSALESINLLGNEFKVFPEVLSKLTTLTEISLSSNKLESVGAEIGKLTNLRILIINNNRLENLPKEIGQLTNLLYLELGNNRLTTLPEEIKHLTQLQELHIEGNRLSESEKERIKKLLPNCVIHF